MRRVAAKLSSQKFYVDRFRPEFKTAFDAWVATDPFVDAAPPRRRRSPCRSTGVAAGEEAAGWTRRPRPPPPPSRRNIQRSSNYVLSVVLYTIVLLFAGMAGKMSSRRLRIGVVVAAYVVLVAALAWVLDLPRQCRGLTGSPAADEALRAQRGPSWPRDRRSLLMDDVPDVPWGKIAAMAERCWRSR